MSNSITTLEQRGWVKRSSPGRDRRVVLIEVTPTGKATVERVGRAAEAHLAELLSTLEPAERRRLRVGLGVLGRVFADAPHSPTPARTRARRVRTTAKADASNR